MMVRRNVIDAIGGLDENYFLYFEETDFCFRAKAAGFLTWYVPQSRVVHLAGQSTKAAGRAPQTRLPAYWFESRRRYFAATHGVYYAMATDVLAILACGLGQLKRIALRRTDRGTPNYLADLARHSMLRSKNRKLMAIKHFMPKR
jgi:GT2 family glycosyltransferase